MLHTLGRNLTDTVITQRNAKFVNFGPYRFVRNPMYTGVLVLRLSLGLAMGTWLTPLGASVIFTLLAIRTRIEEKYLIERFGDPSRIYMVGVGRFLPMLWRGWGKRSSSRLEMGEGGEEDIRARAMRQLFHQRLSESLKYTPSVSCIAVRMLERLAAEGLPLGPSMRIRLLAGICVRFSRS